MPKIFKKTQSASSIKTLNNCSYLYYARYHLRLPDKGNEGQRIGSLCHQIFECFLNKPKYESFIGEIVKSRLIPNSLKRYIRILCKKHNLDYEKLGEKIGLYLIVGFENDFFLGGGILQPPETLFEIINKNYQAKGFIDKYAIYNDVSGCYAVVCDYKSSKNLFSEQELAENIQAYLYLIALKKKHPEININKSIVKFIFLQFPENPIQIVRGNDKILKGVEKYLAYLQGYLDKFDEKMAISNLAANMEFDKPVEVNIDEKPLTRNKNSGFKGKLLCGFAKSPTQLKKNGEKMFACQYKFPFDYYVVLNMDGEIVKSAYTREELLSLDENHKIEKRHFEGCPAFKYLSNSKIDDF